MFTIHNLRANVGIKDGLSSLVKPRHVKLPIRVDGMSAGVDAGVSGDTLYQDIIDKARDIAQSFETQLHLLSLAIVPEKVHQATRFAENERTARHAYLHDLLIQEAASQTDEGEDSDVDPSLILERIPPRDLDSTRLDKALHALDAIFEANVSRTTVVIARNINPGPVYDTWFPVLHNFFVSEPDIDPYRPYFGDHRKGVRHASFVYRQMLNDATGPDRFAYESDPDYDDEGFITDPGLYFSNGLEQRRKRAGQRNAVMQVALSFGKNDAVWTALSLAFGMEQNRVRMYHFIAETRAIKAKEREKRRAQATAQAEAIRNAIQYPYEDITADGKENSAGASQYFCFNCHTFACRRHAGENVEPFRPIPDHATEKRLIDLRRKRAKPCSRKCFLLPDWEQDHTTEGEGLQWTSEEVKLMREGGAIYEVDPCSLAVVIGTKSCREVHVRLQSLEERDLVLKEYQKHITPRARFSGRGVGTAARRGRDRTPRRGRGGWKSRSSQGLKSTRAVTKAKERLSGEHETFVPCNHPGACSVSNGCICVQRNLKCESTCGCNFGRFEETLKGVEWKPPRDTEVRDGISVKCKNRHLGCKCKSGNCNSENCECYIANRLCNPDFCKQCDSVFLPQDILVRDRRCRNVDLITGRHKKTISGESEVHGFGLFAADNFLKGELVGHYSGRTVNPEFVDKMLRTSEARKRTYAFNLTDKYVIDGMCLGGKVRYINHSATDANCEARLERVRGEGRIAIRTTKPVKAGQEFLFDYKITSGNEWLNSETDESDSDNDTQKSSPVAVEIKEEPSISPVNARHDNLHCAERSSYS